jgi:hypothetical protein
MGWETRHGRRYYYRKERTTSGKVRSVYVGSGEDLARVVELADQCRELERQQQAADRAALREAIDAAELPEAVRASLQDAAQTNRAAVSAVLFASGYHRHKGQWRKKRMKTATNSKDSDLVRVETVNNGAELVALIGRADGGDRQAASDLQRILRDRPECLAWVRGLSRQPEAALLESITKNSPGTRAAIEAETEALRQSLGYAQAPALEQMLIDEVVTSFLVLHRWRAEEAIGGVRVPDAQYSQTWSLHVSKKVEAAQRSYVRAALALAKLRRLQVPAVFLQLGGQQVNVLGDVRAGGAIESGNI